MFPLCTYAHSVKEIAHDIEDWGVMPNGRHRFVWKVQNYKSTFARLKTGQKISSAAFTTGDLPWFLDLYFCNLTYADVC